MGGGHPFMSGMGGGHPFMGGMGGNMGGMGGGMGGMGGMGGGRRRQRKPATVQHSVGCTLEELANGTQKKLKITSKQFDQSGQQREKTSGEFFYIYFHQN